MKKLTNDERCELLPREAKKKSIDLHSRKEICLFRSISIEGITKVKINERKDGEAIETNCRYKGTDK